MQRLKKYSSFFLLLLFLFPVVEKQVHTFIHYSDNHCSSTTDKHFHESEHSCNLCDFNFTDSTPLEKSDLSFYIKITPASFNIFIKNSKAADPLYHLPCRAPPVA